MTTREMADHIRRLLETDLDWSREDGISTAPVTTPSGATGIIKVYPLYVDEAEKEFYFIDLVDDTGASKTIVQTGIGGELEAKARAEELLYEEVVDDPRPPWEQ